MNLLIGADPEFFLQDKGNFVSAFGIIDGTKWEPTPVNKGAIQVDGMAVEFNIEPAHDVKSFVHNINTVLQELRSRIPTNYDFSFSPVANFNEDYLASQPVQAVELGCNPDFNAWTGCENPPPDAKLNFRTAAGHLHLGWCEGADPYDLEHMEMCKALVKHLDCSVGLLSVIGDRDNRRRQLYGKAGSFRPKSYGLEYRVLSNYWLANNHTMAEVFHTTSNAFHSFMNGNDFTKINGSEAEKTINEGNFERAAALLRRIGWL